MITALYRISSGEVVKISLTGQTFADRNQTYWGVLTDPSLPDGNQVRDMLPGGVMGELRVLGFAKFAVVGTNTVRNATQAEIDTFTGLETTDKNNQDATQTKALFENHPQFRKAFKALVKRIIDSDNKSREQHNLLRAQIASASNLTDFKNKVATNTTDLPSVTLAQALAALSNDVSAND